MATYEVEDELAVMVEKLARKKPFENLTFQDALWRVIREHIQRQTTIENPDPLGILISDARETVSYATKKPTPSVTRWIESVPELKKHRHLTTWKGVCDHLGVKPGFDSARRKLMKWVSVNKPDWPSVPDID